MPLKGDVMAEDRATEDYWKKPDPQEQAAHRQNPPIGMWSRLRALRISVWIVVMLLTLFLALVASAYLSGFSSVFEMFNWLTRSLR
jgi:hypothetical protein